MDKRVLVVDDEACMLEIVSCMLEKLGCYVDSADSGHAATRCLIESGYDAVVTDFNMPDMDGYTLAEWINDNSPDTTVIIMTGCHHSEVTDYMNTGIVDGWIFKPFSLKALSDQLDACVDQATHVGIVAHARQIGRD
jgi:two-component system, NarL family, capsular synthesis sensor histidine kinase RcsC